MEEERKERISLIDKATDLLRGSVENVTTSLALFMTGWFVANLILDNGEIEDSKENYDALNGIEQAKASFFTDAVVPFLAGISLVFWNLNNLNKKYYKSIDEDLTDDMADEIAEAISSAFGFSVTDNDVEINPNGWLADVGDMKSVYAQIRESAIKAISSRMPLDDFLKVLKKEIQGDESISGIVANHFRTIIWDVYAEYDRMVGYKYAIGLNYRAAIYEGGLIDRSRDFCIERNGNVYTFDEIQKFGTPQDVYEGYSNKAEGKFDGKPKFDYDPFFDQGGHNCRHAYSYIPDRLAIHLRPELRDVFQQQDKIRPRSNASAN